MVNLRKFPLWQVTITYHSRQGTVEQTHHIRALDAICAANHLPQSSATNIGKAVSVHITPTPLAIEAAPGTEYGAEGFRT